MISAGISSDVGADDSIDFIKIKQYIYIMESSSPTSLPISAEIIIILSFCTIKSIINFIIRFITMRITS